ncbi:Fungalysin metallopeptidase (M36) [Luteitalea pratensis]|uniref:Fungalysin metallopeptidase (M36) n=1 Tax=Luteitalea pratensis TaxID=1855912 RepID=A0A143PH92_LUTPR|nr:M36 family metallopeptidase [Luteitalea pratensis]AMY07650.1 Fungalysin metallopeptidase (M36) [Luteitalea pratensis]
MVPRTFVVVAGLLVASVAAAPAVAQDAAAAAALDYIRGSRQTLGLTGSDVGDVVVSSVVRSDHNRVTHVYLQQRYRGIEVWSGILNVAVDANSAVVSAQSRFVTNIASQAGGQNAKKAALDAVAAAAGHVRLKPTRAFEVLQHKGGPSEAVTLSDGGISLKPIEARLVWVPLEGAVRLGWMVEIEEVGGAHWWQAFVDAETGASLGQHDLIVHDSAHAIAAAIARPADSPAALPTFAATDGAAYRVFPLPFESPNDGDRSLVTNAADPASSPFGWHDTNGVAGPEFTRTRGNNVHAYADRDANNTADPGSDPDGGPGLLFDFNLDLLARPLDSQPAIVTNLFYWNNIVHDVTYRYGFNEAAGNFQVNNYGKGGLGNDDVRAEAQDGSGRNNANFGTNVDGARPRMQMFEWRSSAPNPITVTAPAAAAGTYYGPMAGFGESLVTTGPIAGEVVYIGRGCDPAYQAGQPLDPYLASPAGKIALTERGSCTFVAKVKKAQDSGARAVIVANNIVGSPIAMGGADPTISIPSVMVSLDDGTLFKANVPLTATIADGTGGVPDRDSDLDAGVIAHEYGHGISNRLTGGPATVACLGNAEQMGEGWSDWFALTLTTHPSDTGTTPRGVGTYVNFEPADGLGIRPTQYTTDMTVNPSTYASVADTVNISQPHGIGYVWNTMLWEMYWNLVDRYGYNADIYDSWNTGGNNRALQLVMDGLKFQVCRPGFVDGRTGILQADVALTGGANQCEIWRAFARRGLGASASQGSSNDRTDGVEAFDLPANCTAATFGGFTSPIEAAPGVNAVNAGSVVPVKFTVEATSVVTLADLDSQPVSCSTLEPTGEAPVALDSPGSTGLGQDGNAYHVNWQTDPTWAGTCRRLTVRLPAASDATAYFRFF